MANNKIVFAGQTLIDLTADDITAADVISTKKFHLPSGNTATGTMPNRGKVAGKIKTGALTYTVPQGYHDGTGTVEVEEPDLIADNIRKGITLLGVEGTLQGGEAPAYAYLVVYYPAGSVCTCTDGVTVLTAENDSGGAVFRLPGPGTWTASCTDGTDTATMDAEITYNGEVQSVELSYHLYFYRYGDPACEEVSGGFSYNNYNWQGGANKGTPTVSTRSDGGYRMYRSGGNVAWTMCSNNKVDLTEYNRFVAILDVVSFRSGDCIGMFNGTSVKSSVAMSTGTAKEFAVDISSMIGNYNLGIRGSTGNSTVYDVTLLEARLEK